MPDFSPPSPQGLIDLAWLTLLHSAWLGMLAGAVGSLMIALGRPASPRARHATIVVLLAVVTIAAPAAALTQRSWIRRDITPVFIAATGRTKSLGLPRGVAVAGAAPSPASAPESTTVGPPAGLGRMIVAAGSLLAAARPYLLAVWAAGASASLGAMAVGSHSLRRLRRKSAPCPAPGRRARTFGRMLRLGRTPDVLQHPGIDEPCLAGSLRPVVLLPSRWLTAARVDEIDAVLAHELAHARRLDHLTNLFLRAVEAAYCFHPAVRLGSRLARREAERAADALAVRLTGDPLALARALESVARSRPSRPRLLRPGLAVGGDRSALFPRIQELLGMKPNRPRFPLGVFATLPAAAILATVAISTAPAQEGRPPAVAADSRDDHPQARPAITRQEFLRVYRADPETLSHEDLIKRLEAIGGPGPGLVGKSREELIRDAKSGEVSFEVRFVEVIDVERDPFEDAPMTPVEPGASWIATPKGLDAVLKAVASSPPSHVVQCPKVTTFEGASATMIVGARPESFPIPKSSMEIEGARCPNTPVDGNAGIIQVDLDGPPVGPGSGKDGKSGWAEAQRMDVRGTKSGEGHRVNATLVTRYRDVRFACLDPRSKSDDVEAEALDLRRTAACEVPDGSSLVIAGGIHGRWPGTYFALPRLVRGYAIVTPHRVGPEAIEAAALARIEEAGRATE